MTDQQDGSIIRRENSSLSKAAPSGNPLISRMAGDVLSRAKSNQIAQERIQLGDYSFRPPDYRQIMRWAETLRLDPLELVRTFERIGGREFQVVDGAIVSLQWDLKALPISPNDWVEGLTIRTLRIRGRGFTDSHDLRFTSSDLPHLTDLDIWVGGGGKLTVETIALSKLESLFCRNCSLSALRLQDVPTLSSLSIHRGKLSALDLSHYSPRLTLLQLSKLSVDNLADLDLSLFPNLRTLSLRESKLNRLDLQPLKRLESLACSDNRIKELDLSPVPLLTDLDCKDNQLKELDLSPAPLLTRLDCSNNPLKELDLISAPMLKELHCSNSNLKELDLNHTPLLEELWCDENELTRLDLSSVTSLDELNCMNNQITELDLKPVPALTRLGYDKHRIPKLDLTHTPLLDQVNPNWMGA